MLSHDPPRSRFYIYVRCTVITLSFRDLKMIYSHYNIDPPTKHF